MIFIFYLLLMNLAEENEEILLNITQKLNNDSYIYELVTLVLRRLMPLMKYKL
jgi:hypothetical protein